MTTRVFKLTDKEILVLAGLMQGYTDKAIALYTGISLHVVRGHLVKSIMQKLGLNNRTQCAVWAWRNGIEERAYHIKRNGQPVKGVAL